ncbi:UDP-3-O-(3-hydroxymyristoyl)glucosamine N-acyltransferase [Sporohalobacter salinus]|uniref:UDP-3-O-(3-hydroxymyristoyl)glucosamine N-acyltransferase n=1 Tax=Sporohalobacter salinus TaxID=1494606 RepID=UPI001960352F|nr:UDP-3-O-(3-hydroxymyristoyl)glucosamine N-acyltransferase [Sporohalobacter salinus]MBM7622919.1 UDP-3-O-[3-hydroxymyristoyl] glucosamine N-acyltransferase [Sporohalobacter salinus]
MTVSLKELANLVNGEVIGNDEVIISGVGGVENVTEGEITFVQNDKYLKKAESSSAAAIIVNDRIESNKALLKVDNPRLAFAKIAHEFTPQLYKTNEIHPTAVIANDVEFGSDVSIGSQVTIESGVSIGDNVRIAPGAYIGAQAQIGNETIIHPNAVIMHETEIGNRVIIQAGSVIGSDGYGFETTPNGHYKVPQFGNVIIEDDVELGANVTVDRGATGSTIIGKGTKTDNLVHIAHNVEIGEGCLLIAQVGIAGSAKIGEGVTLAGKAGVVGHLEIGANTTVAAQSVITKDVPPDSFYSGYPAQDHKSEMRIKAARRRLPKMVKELRALKQEISELKGKLEEE